MIVDTRNPQLRILAVSQRYGTIDLIGSGFTRDVIRVETFREMGSAAGAFRLELLPRIVDGLSGLPIGMNWSDIL